MVLSAQGIFTSALHLVFNFNKLQNYGHGGYKREWSVPGGDEHFPSQDTRSRVWHAMEAGTPSLELPQKTLEMDVQARIR